MLLKCSETFQQGPVGGGMDILMKIRMRNSILAFDKSYKGKSCHDLVRKRTKDLVCRDHVTLPDRTCWDYDFWRWNFAGRSVA